MFFRKKKSQQKQTKQCVTELEKERERRKLLAPLDIKGNPIIQPDAYKGRKPTHYRGIPLQSLEKETLLECIYFLSSRLDESQKTTDKIYAIATKRY